MRNRLPKSAQRRVAPRFSSLSTVLGYFAIGIVVLGLLWMMGATIFGWWSSVKP